MTAVEHIESEPTRVVHRTITPRDLPFITNSWLESNRKRAFKYLDKRVYFHWHHKLLEHLIPTSNVIVACDREDPDRIYGYGVAQSDAPTLLVHFVYVREGWRGVGIGSSILRAWIERWDPTALVWTHSSEAWESFVDHLRREGTSIPGVFNPYLAYLAWAEAEAERKRR